MFCIKFQGLFAGGTHCAETAMILKKMQADHKEFGNFQMDIIDLGDDEYCVGKPHPMIDGTTRYSNLSSSFSFSRLNLISSLLIF